MQLVDPPVSRVSTASSEKLTAVNFASTWLHLNLNSHRSKLFTIGFPFPFNPCVISQENLNREQMIQRQRTQERGSWITSFIFQFKISPNQSPGPRMDSSTGRTDGQLPSRTLSDLSGHLLLSQLFDTYATTSTFEA